MSVLTFSALRNANNTRQLEWPGNDKADLAFRTIEVAGEFGEVAEAVKKYLRSERGIKGTTASIGDVGEEMADAIIALDLLAAEIGIDLSDAVTRKFNQTSVKYEMQTRLHEQSSQPTARKDHTMSRDEQAIEAEIKEKGLTAKRVTPEMLDAEIVAVDYHVFSGSCLTVCCITLKNGFTVTGESACASPENFDSQLGRKIAHNNARGKIWPLLGFRLRDQLAQADTGEVIA